MAYDALCLAPVFSMSISDLCPTRCPIICTGIVVALHFAWANSRAYIPDARAEGVGKRKGMMLCGVPL